MTDNSNTPDTFIFNKYEIDSNGSPVLCMFFFNYMLGNLITDNTTLSRSEVFFKKNVFLEILKNSQENTCARVSFLKKLQAATLLKKRLWHRCFHVNFEKFSRTPFLQSTSMRVLLNSQLEKNLPITTFSN